MEWRHAALFKRAFHSAFSMLGAFIPLAAFVTTFMIESLLRVKLEKHSNTRNLLFALY